MWLTIRERLCHKTVIDLLGTSVSVLSLKTLKQIKAQKPQFYLSKVSEGVGVTNKNYSLALRQGTLSKTFTII